MKPIPKNRRPGKTVESGGGRPWLGNVKQSLAPGVNAFLEKLAVFDDPETPDAGSLNTLILVNAVEQRATDIHLEPVVDGWRVRYRIDGRLHDVAQLPAELGRKLVRLIRTHAGLEPVVTFLPQDAACQTTIDGHRLDLRLAFAPCHNGDKIAIRLLDPDRVRHRIEDLGLSCADLSVLKQWVGEICGMCLISGPTGSGKTTTLYAMVKELNLAHHSLATVEDPVEYPFDGITQIQIDERHGLDFPTGLKAMLRLDPDYLIVGEMRDADSAHTAVHAASTGHFLLSTLHSPDGVGVVTLLRDWGVPDLHIATVLELIINQRLVRRLCMKCREPGAPREEEKRWLEGVGLNVPAEVWHAAGCEACNGSGYSRRIGVFEIWRRDESDYRLILDHADEHTLRRHLQDRGLKNILDDGLSKAVEGITSIEELRSMAAHAGFLVSRPGKKRGRRRG